MAWSILVVTWSISADSWSCWVSRYHRYFHAGTAPRERYLGLIRRYPYGHPDPFLSVRDLGRVRVGCSWRSREPGVVRPRGSQRGSRPGSTRGSPAPWSWSPITGPAPSRRPRCCPCPDPSPQPGRVRGRPPHFHRHADCRTHSCRRHGFSPALYGPYERRSTTRRDGFPGALAEFRRAGRSAASTVSVARSHRTSMFRAAGAAPPDCRLW